MPQLPSGHDVTPGPTSAPARPVLVTGAAGFAGSHLVHALQGAGLPVQALVRTEADRARLPQDIDVIVGDIRHEPPVRRAVAGVGTVFHLAAAYRKARQSNADYRSINVDATASVVEAAARAGVTRVVLCSTCGVHGDVGERPVGEDAPLAPGDVYQQSKLDGEQAARTAAARHGLELVVVRPSGLYGPGDRRFLKLFRTIARGRFRMIGTGHVAYHLTYIDDFVTALRRAADVPAAAGGTYLIAGPQATTVRRLVATIADALNVPAPTASLPAGPILALAGLCEAVCRPLRIEPPLHRRRLDFFLKHRHFDTTRARRDLNFVPAVGMVEGVRLTAAWYRDRGWL